MSRRFKLALAQCAHPEDGDVLAMADSWADRAQAAGADMLAFPECLMTPYEKEPEEFAASAQTLDGDFSRGMDAMARRHGLWIVYTVNELNLDGGRPYNTAVVTGSDGIKRARYRKVHLFDAGDYRESSKMSAGDSIFEPTDTPFCRLGLGICYDLRFPELALKQALSGCELIVYPAAWVAGEGKVGQWQTLLRARAIENGMFVAGLCRVGSNCIGNSLVVGPAGETVARAGDGEELLLCEIDPEEVASTRRKMPSLQHRRPDLY